MQFVRTNSDDIENPAWFEIRPNMEEHIASWSAYFKWRFRVLPWGMRKLLNAEINMFLVPCEWPVWFDENYGRNVKLLGKERDHVQAE